MPEDKPVHRLLTIINWRVKMKLKNMLDPYDFNPGEFPFLATLLEQEEGITQKELCDQMLISKSTTSKRINNLEEKGYIKKRRDPDDRRKTRIYLTNRKKEVKELTEKMNNKADNLMLKNFDDEEKNQFIEYLIRILNNIEDN